jgi:iron complex outermembrane recepter protein
MSSLCRPLWRSLPVFPVAFCAVSLVPSFTFAAEPPPPTAAATPATEEVVTLDAYTVSASEADLYNVLPTRPSSSVFGTERSLQDTPRSVTLIESSLTDLYGIRTVNDFVALTAGTYTGNYFGVPGALTVRGASADNFFRGFRRIENRGNFPTIIGGTDYVEIIKGPPPPVYGGGKVGGILNFIPKTAKSKTAQYIDAPTGEVTVTIGTYDKKIASLEYGLPFTLLGKKSGAYFYMQNEDSGSYYDNVYNQSQLYQLSVDTTISDTLHLEYGGMFQRANLNQSLGWNRVTQDMIDSNGRYLSGRPVNLDANNDGYINPSEIPTGSGKLMQFAFAPSGFPYQGIVDPTIFNLQPGTIQTVKLDHHTVQAEKIDFSDTDAITGFFDVVKELSPDLTLKNQSFYDSQNHTKYSSYGFAADYQQYVLENKTSLLWKTQPTANLKFENIAGFSFRYTDGVEQEYRSNDHQALDRRDIYFGATGNDRFPRPGQFGAGTYEWQQRGHFSDTGVFVSTDATYREKLSAVLSGRFDSYDATVTGTSAVPSPLVKSKQSDTAGTYNASLSYKLTPTLTPYFTHARSSFVELGQGGIIARDNLDNDAIVQDSTLYEAGIKTTAFGGKLFATLAVYQQEKTGYDTNANLGGTNTYTSKGLEIEARYAPTKRWSFTGTATVQTTEAEKAPFILGIPPEALGLDPALNYGGRYFGPGGSNPGLGLTGKRTVPIPEQAYSLGVTYTDPQGWGFSIGETYVSSMYSGYLELVRLPAYFVTNAALFYNYKSWSVRLNGKNILNEQYFTPQALFEDTFISPSQGPTYDLTIAYKF